MPLSHIHIFQNCGWSLEDLTDKDGNVVGSNLVIFDNAEHEVWKFPMAANEARTMGQRLMGIGNTNGDHSNQDSALIAQLHRRGGRAI